MGFRFQSGRIPVSVVCSLISARGPLLRNALNFGMKAIGWLSTGSHSMFAETIHSLVDTAQQVDLSYNS